MTVPADLVLVGHVLDAWRLDGGVKVAPYSVDAAALLGTKTWWFDVGGTFREIEVLSAKVHGKSVTAKLMGIADRDTAEMLKGARISVSRRFFPVPDDDEFYWVDLIGAAVVNGADETLGTVADLMDTGAQQVLVVREIPADGEVVERLIPFVDAVVSTVDVPGKRIVVDWQRDY